MMKKIVCIMLVTLMVLGLSGAALAETEIKLNENSDRYNFYITITNGMALTQEPLNLGIMGAVEIGGHDSLVILFALNPDDSYSGMSMSEMTDTEIEEAAGLLTEDLGAAEKEKRELPSGLAVLTITEDSKSEYINIALMEGYVFGMVASHADYSPLSDEEIEIVKGIFDTLRMEEVTAQ